MPGAACAGKEGFLPWRDGLKKHRVEQRKCCWLPCGKQPQKGDLPEGFESGTERLFAVFWCHKPQNTCGRRGTVPACIWHGVGYPCWVLVLGTSAGEHPHRAGCWLQSQGLFRTGTNKGYTGGLAEPGQVVAWALQAPHCARSSPHTHEQVASAPCAAVLSPVESRRSSEALPKAAVRSQFAVRVPLLYNLSRRDTHRAAAARACKAEPRAGGEMLLSAGFLLLLFQPPGGWACARWVLSTRCGGISVCLFSPVPRFLLFPPDLFKALTCKSTIKPL